LIESVHFWMVSTRKTRSDYADKADSIPASLAGNRVIMDNAASVVTRAGPLATTYREPGQARKGAATAVDSGAGVWRVRAAALSFPALFASYLATFLC